MRIGLHYATITILKQRKTEEFNQLDMFLSWWNQTETKEKFIQILVFFLFFGISLDLKNWLFGIPLILTGLLMINDCIKRKSLAVFYLPVRYWLGLAVFMGAVVLASVLLGEWPSISLALQNVYWCLPFIAAVYLGKQADIKYAALLGVIASLLVSFSDLLYLAYYTGLEGRLGAFGKHPNGFAVLLLGVLPFIIAAFQDGRIRAHKKYCFLLGIVTVLGLWSLWKTGSRGGIIGFFVGGILIYGVICFYRKRFKQFLTGFAVCIAVMALLLVVIAQGQNRGYSDPGRLRMLKSSYAMWQDHKLTGVGLANWHKVYVTNYLLKDEIETEALQKYQEWKKAEEQREEEERKAAAAQKAEAAKKAAAKKAVAQKAAAEREAKQIASWKQGAVKYAMTAHVMPHNVIAWFFSTTGSIGGCGYLFFVCWYILLFCKIMKRSDVSWIDVVGFWVFLAITTHGMLDAGIIHKNVARLLYLVMGLSISYDCRTDRKRLPEDNGKCGLK